MTDLALESRDRLPDALRALVEEYPRASWEAQAHFGGLVQFWLERHMMFRKLMELLRSDAEKMLDGDADPRRYGGRLSRYGAMLVNELHGHHTIEDVHYFPVLAGREASVARGFEILDADHHALDGHLASFTDGANGVLTRLDAPQFHDLVGGFHSDLLRLERLLDRHLEDEEELVVPVILKHGPSGLG